MFPRVFIHYTYADHYDTQDITTFTESLLVGHEKSLLFVY